MQQFDKTRLFRAILSILLTISTVQGEDGCKVLEYLDCVKNKTFTGHVIKSFTVLAPGLEMCQHKCFLEDKCVSYNLGPGGGMTRTCELSDADNMTRPGFLRSKKDFEYCPIKNPCSSSPCPPGRLCIPHFSWDTFSCDDGAWARWGSWTTCPIPVCIMTRRRNCTNPAPQNNGSYCSGSGIDTKKCYTPKVNTTGCESPLGVEHRSIILDSQITASSSYAARFAPKEGRLNNQFVSKDTTIGAWAAKHASAGEYLQVDLLSVKMITKIATQGSPYVSDDERVTEYSVSYSNNSLNWKNYERDCLQKLPGNSNATITVTNKLDLAIMARYIRIVVQKWNNWPSMRLELYGCSLPAP